jgi:arylformamidase
MLYRQFKTQEELDDEYRPEARITDPTAFDKLIEKRRTLSASAKAELTRKADLRYGPTLIERLDVYPAAEPNAPIVIFIHGGYWFDASLTKDMYVWVAKGFVGHGVTTVIVDYEVCPKVTIDEIVRQCRAAVSFVYRHAEDFDSDRSRIYVTGNSAGGHLTSLSDSRRMTSIRQLRRNHGFQRWWATDAGSPARRFASGGPVSGQQP